MNQMQHTVNIWKTTKTNKLNKAKQNDSAQNRELNETEQKEIKLKSTELEHHSIKWIRSQ